MRALAIALLLITACKGSDERATPQPAPEPTPIDPDPTPPADAATLKQHMKVHFDAIREIERALVAGDLAKAKERAGWLAAHEPHEATELWEPHLNAVRESAEALTAAKDLESATDLAAKLGGQCAQCHVTTTAIVSFPYEELPPAGDDNRVAMRRHQWAADRMWEGLIGPSRTGWIQGAEVLGRGSVHPADLAREREARRGRGAGQTGSRARADRDRGPARRSPGALRQAAADLLRMPRARPSALTLTGDPPGNRDRRP